MLSSEPRMSRSRLYIAIDAFESDMRSIVDRYILDHLDDEVALGNEYEKAAERKMEDGAGSEAPITMYLDLRPCYDVLNRHRNNLPVDLASEVRENTPQLDRLVPIRNRVMHGRPLREDDHWIALSALRNFQSRFWQLTRSTLDHLDSDDLWEPEVQVLKDPNEKVIHNLPPVEYDDTGLVGRRDEVEKVRAMLKKRRDPIVTVTGEGGVGKTALALEVAYSLVDDSNPPYECVLWVSLKTERLTAAGVASIVDALHGIGDAAIELGRSLDSTFEGTSSDLAESLEGLSTLIIIDNLEALNGDEVVRFYDMMPSSVNFLFTSRIGIGEIERRYPLGPLSETSAISLIRNFARSRAQHSLTSLTPDTARTVVERLRYSPLAIRWFVLSVEAGNDPLATIHDQSELLQFCVANVYDGLSPDARKLLAIVRVLDQPMTLNEMALLSDLEVDPLRRAAQELSRGSLIVHESDSTSGLGPRIGPSLAVKKFLPRDTVGSEELAGIIERQEEYRKGREARRKDEASRKLAPWVVYVRDEDDEPTAHLLRLALRESKRKRVKAAFDYIAKARLLNPDYFEVDRVDAFIRSGLKEPGAIDLYRDALDKSTDERSRAVVAHFLAGHLARVVHDVPLAIEFEREAHAVFESAETALALGNFLVWNDMFEDGQELLEYALDNCEDSSRVIVVTTIVESWRRWAEHVQGQHRPDQAFRFASTGFSLGVRELSNVTDLKLAGAVASALAIAVRGATTTGVDLRPVEKLVQSMLDDAISLMRLFESSDQWVHAKRILGRCVRSGLPREIVERVHRLLRINANADAVPLVGDTLIGTVVSYSQNYGFINHPSYPGNVFFHRSDVVGPDYDHFDIVKGALVDFAVFEDDRGSRATGVRLRRSDAQATEGFSPQSSLP